MRVLKHIGSNFPERDGGGILVKTRTGTMLYYTEGGRPGEELEVFSYDVGDYRGYKTFVKGVSAPCESSRCACKIKLRECPSQLTKRRPP